MRRFSSPAIRLALWCAVGLLGACSDASSQAIKGTDSAVVAEIGSYKVTLQEVDQKALMADAGNFGGMKLLQALYEARRQAIDGIVSARLIETEAKAQGISGEELTRREVTAKMAPVQDADIQAWYRGNPSRIQGAPLEQVAAPIRQLLEQERREQALAGFVDRLKAKTTIRVSLDPPRQEVTVAANDPAMGPADAPIQIVEYSDFQ